MKTGIDRFTDNRVYSDRSIGVVTNHTGRFSSGELTIDGLMDRGFQVKALFSPEHGLFGVDQDGIETCDGTYRGIPSWSLYGNRRKPSKEQLKGLDLILFDMQDLGIRFYTYLYTLAYVMEAASESSIELVVTDRPVPLGRSIEGNPITREKGSFVGDYGLPVRTGLTIGEYARYIKKYYYPQASLTVIPMEDYRLGWWDSALPWVNPSPNIPCLTSALVYGGTCLFEGTSVSEGRGTTRPFETLGAPGIDGTRLTSYMNNLSLPGVVFSQVRFKPFLSKHMGKVCEGVQVNITDRNIYNSLLVGTALVCAFFNLFPDQASLRPAEREGATRFIDKLTGVRAFGDQLTEGADYRELHRLISGREEEFALLRESCLLYS